MRRGDPSDYMLCDSLKRGSSYVKSVGRGGDLQEKTKNTEWADLNRKKMEVRERKLVTVCAAVLSLIEFSSLRNLSRSRR